MIAIARPTTTLRKQRKVTNRNKRTPASQHPAWHDRYLRLLPDIKSTARFSFRHLKPEAREHAVQEVIARSFVTHARLVERDKEDLAYAAPLTRYAVAQYREGRTVGTSMNGKDVFSPLRRSRSQVCSVQSGDTSQGWQELVVEDKRATPAELAATRVDFQSWLGQLPKRMRSIAELLATGESTHQAAHEFGVSPARISQIRRELQDNWEEFQGEDRGADR